MTLTWYILCAFLLLQVTYLLTVAKNPFQIWLLQADRQGMPDSLLSAAGNFHKMNHMSLFFSEAYAILFYSGSLNHAVHLVKRRSRWVRSRCFLRVVSYNDACWPKPSILPLPVAFLKTVYCHPCVLPASLCLYEPLSSLAFIISHCDSCILDSETRWPVALLLCSRPSLRLLVLFFVSF